MRRAWQALFVALVLIVAWLALTPVPPRELSTGWDKANHLLAFGSLMLVGRLAWPRRWWPMALGLVAYGGAIELLQLLVPGRESEWADLLADSLGIALGELLSPLALRLFKAT
ncbi:VanZ family protein [Pelomonas sp. SE-A7]|uniref:VanZ family protein n=1 Tax=Pelomonas sp. SE-A7 TaxID=3054953 RepID=UPI00259CBD55|nr:VanZ family protein [Pelomonas sp. SE-A7]MDM4767322.1 VanZ family protein [Pelomonas sp. SE-A7]